MCTTRVTAATTSLRSGEASLDIGSPTTFTSTPSPTTPASARRTSSIFTPGKMRQLTLAVADCGSAFCACPPSSMVATQVVRVWPTYDGIRGQRGRGGFVFRIRGELRHRRAKLTRRGLAGTRGSSPMVVSFHITGKLNCAQFHERRGEIVDGVVGARRELWPPGLRVVSVKSA